MKTLILNDDTAAALQMLLSNLSPLMFDHTAEKCRSLYGGDHMAFYRRLTNAADDTVKALKDRANFEQQCG